MRVVLAYPYTTPGGRHFQPDTTITVDLEEGQRLIRGGLARPADKPAKRSSARSASKRAPTKEKD